MIHISGKSKLSKAIRRTGAALASFFLLCGIVACTRVRIFTTQSRFPEQQVVIDGRSDDWAGKLFIVEDAGVTLGFLNDRDCLYICLRADEGGSGGQIMRSGLTVWFDPQGGKKKALGIKFPVGMTPGERPMPPGDFGEEEEGPGSRRPGEENLNQLEIIRSENEEPEKMEIGEAKGIEIKAQPSRSGLVYELKIPLLRSDENPIAVGAEPGKTIGIGFETGKFEPGDMPRGRGRMPGTGGMPGGGGMPPMGGGMGGIGPGRGFEMPEDIKIWATVKLSSGQSPEAAELQSLSHSL